MMFDYQEASLYTGKGTPNLAYLTPAYSKTNWDWYRLDLGVTPLQVGYSEPLRELRVKGSFPYYGQGHNATHSIKALRECWQYVEGILNVKLFGAYITAFEFGTILETPCKPSLLLEHHTRLPGFETRSYQSKSGILKGREFHSSAHLVKLYDPIANFKAKRLSKADYTRNLGLLPGNDYLRIENHYKNPERYFKERILLTDFFRPEFQQRCKTDLMDIYGKIIKSNSVPLPDDKSKLSTANIVLAFAQRIAQDSGINAEDQLRKLITSIPSDVFTKEDRKARKRQLGKMFAEISTSGQSSFDLSELLRQKLDTEES